MDLLKEAELLRRVPMFAKLEPSRLKLLAFTSEYLTYDDGEIVFRVGDPGDCAYVIIEGEVDIIAETETGEVVVATLGRNALFGELALLNNVPRTATIRARGQLHVLRIADDVFLKLLAENSDVALDVIRQLSEKLAKAHRQFEEHLVRLRRCESSPKN